MNKEGLIILGAGGHAKVVFSTAIAAGEKICSFLDDPTLFNMAINSCTVIGDTKLLSAENWAVFGLTNNSIRKNVTNFFNDFSKWKTLIHPTAYVHPSVEIGEGAVVLAGAVIQPDVKIGKHCIINTGATIDHDCVIGDYSHLAPGVHLAGNVQIGEGGFLGIGSVAIPGIVIGDWVTVGAGGVVVNNLLAGKTVMGIPAKERLNYAKNN